MFKGLIFDKSLHSFFDYSGNNIITQIFRNGDQTHLNDEGNYIKIEDEIDVISFLPNSKIEKVDDVWVNSCRVKIKVGRFIRKFITEFSISNFNINTKMIEEYVNFYKSYFSRDKSMIKIVTGNDILKYYLEENYHMVNGNRYGTLWNSCMRQKDRNIFMKLYADNSQEFPSNSSVKLLVLFSEDGKVRARALLWDGVKEHFSGDYTSKSHGSTEFKFMDRIYYVYDHDINFLKDWAKENGYLSKTEQSAKSEIYFDDIDGNRIKKFLYVNLKNTNVSLFPYLDTFKFYNRYLKRFSNSDNYEFDHILVQSNGLASREPEEVHFDDDDDDFIDED